MLRITHSLTTHEHLEHLSVVAHLISADAAESLAALVVAGTQR